jgi:hypothetical protein
MFTDQEKRENDRLRKAFEKLDTLITRAELLAIADENSRREDERKD